MQAQSPEAWRVILFTDMPVTASWYKGFLAEQGHRFVAAPLDALHAAHGPPPDPGLTMLARYLALHPFPPRFQDPALPLARPLQPRRDHAGVVEDQQIAFTEQRRRIAYEFVLKAAPRRRVQQARAVARARGAQRDQRLR